MKTFDLKLKKLEDLWNQGHPISKIGEMLGVSRNSVAGKAHRMGLAKRTSPISSEKKQSVIEPVLDSKIALVVSPYYSEITDNLIAGAKRALLEVRVQTEIIEVDGALEIPGAISIIREKF